MLNIYNQKIIYFEKGATDFYCYNFLFWTPYFGKKFR